MIDNENFTASLSENLLTILVFDDKLIQVLASNIKVQYFDNIYHKTIAKKAIDYYNKYKSAPKEHIADLLEKEILSDKSEIYKSIIVSLYENNKTINTTYILDELEKFIRIQNLKSSILKASEFAQVGDLDKAENEIFSLKKNSISVFDPGTFLLKDIEKSIDFLNTSDEDGIFTGIRELDKLKIIPYPKELYIAVGRSGGGKSWFIIHLAKMAVMQKKKVLHITLELSEDRAKARYSQSLFALSTTNAELQTTIPIFITDTFGNLTNIEFKDIGKRKTLQDPDIEEYISNQMKKFYDPCIIIKEFPTGTLSINALRSYLDNLEAYHNFIPDILLLDYLDLMSLDIDKLRLDLGQTAIALRGIAVERNIAVVTAAQTNAKAEDIMVITRKHLAEDFSKVRIADNLITINQLPLEKQYGLARIYVDKSRNAKGDGTIIQISQNLSLGQFCLGSCRGSKDYMDIFEGFSGSKIKPIKSNNVI